MWWMWCSVPIKICCHAAQTTRNKKSLNHDRAKQLYISSVVELHLSEEAFPVLNQIWRDDIWTRGQWSVNTAKKILIYESLGHCVSLHPGVDKVCPNTGVMAQSRQGALTCSRADGSGDTIARPGHGRLILITKVRLKIKRPTNTTQLSVRDSILESFFPCIELLCAEYSLLFPKSHEAAVLSVAPSHVPHPLSDISLRQLIRDGVSHVSSDWILASDWPPTQSAGLWLADPTHCITAYRPCRLLLRLSRIGLL